jgi:hypothetical protein
MAASTITRDTWTNDTGSAAVPNADGTILNNSVLQNNIYARIDAMFSGAGAYATCTFGGLIVAEGFGVHNFITSTPGVQRLRVTQSGAGLTSEAILQAISDTVAVQVGATTSTFTATTYKKQAAGYLASDGLGGLSLAATNALGDVRVFSGGSATAQWVFDHSAGALIPGIDVTYDLGATFFRIRNIYAGPGFTYLNATGRASTTYDHIGNTSTGAATATLTNAPTAGNPTGWMHIYVSGALRYVPFWS